MAELEDRLTVAPVDALTATVQVLDPPGDRFAGVQLTALTIGSGTRLSVTLFEDPFNDAVMLGVSLAVNWLAAALNVALVEPAATLTEAGTVKFAELDDRFTVAPVAALTATVQVLDPPGDRFAGVQLTTLTVGRTTRLSVTLFDDPFNDAVMLGVSLAVNWLAAALNVALVEPTPTLTEVGTVRFAELDDRLTSAPVDALTLTVHVLDPAGDKVAGVQLTALTVGSVAATRLSVALFDEPFNDAVTVGVSPVVNCLAVALNVALV